MASTYETSPPPPAAVRTENRFDEPDHIEVDYRRDDRGELRRRVSWGAIFAGTAIAISLVLLLTLLGVGIGTATIDPAPSGDGSPGLGGLATGSGIWLIVSQLFALLIGGIVAARLAGVPLKGDSMLHGMAVWALATVATFWLATTAIGTIAGGTASLLGKAGGGLTSVVQAVVPDDLTLDSLIPNIDTSDLPPEMQQAIREKGLTPDEVQAETKDMVASVISPQERQRALDIVKAAATDAITDPGTAGTDVSAAADQLFGGPDAVISDEDLEQLKSQMSSRFGISEQQSQETIDKWQAQTQEAIDGAKQKADEVKLKAQQAAETAASAVSSAAFLAFVASLLGLIAAVIGGLIGRPKDSLSRA